MGITPQKLPILCERLVKGKLPTLRTRCMTYYPTDFNAILSCLEVVPLQLAT